MLTPTDFAKWLAERERARELAQDDPYHPDHLGGAFDPDAPPPRRKEA